MIPAWSFLLAGRIVVGASQLVMMWVLTAFLDAREMGKYYLWMSVISAVSLLAINPITVYLQRHLHGWNEKKVARFAVRKLLLFLCVIGVGTSGILWGVNQLAVGDLDLPAACLGAAVSLLVVLSALAALFPGLCNLLGRPRAFVLFSSVDSWGRIGAICLFALILPRLAGTVLWAMAGWGAVSALLSGRYLYKRLQRPGDEHDPFSVRMIRRDLLAFVWPLAVSSGLYWGQSEGYRFILQNLAGTDAVGRFVVAYSLGAAPMIALDTLFHQCYLPIFYREIAAETAQDYAAAWNKYAEKVMSGFIPLGVCTACAGPFLARWLVHANYRDIGIYAAFGAISQLLRIFSASFYFGVVAQRNTSLLILPVVLGALVALGGTFVLARQSPIFGVGASLILSHLVVSIGSYLQLRKKIAVRIPWARMQEAVVWSVPLGLLLLFAHRLGWEAMPLSNLLTLALIGLGMLYIHWRLAEGAWLRVRAT